MQKKLERIKNVVKKIVKHKEENNYPISFEKERQSAEKNVTSVASNVSAANSVRSDRLNPKDFSDNSLSSEQLPPEIKSKLKSHQKDTGVDLVKRGYKPLKCIGVGANGVVWICKDSTGKEVAVKVTCDSKMFGLIKIKASKEEISNAKVLEEIINKDGGRASKYLVISKHDDQHIDKKRAVFTSELADKGDLEHYRSSKKNYDRFLEILETGINILEGLKILHDAGYSHNDVKPDNLFAITESNSIAAARQAGESANLEHLVVKLADFGCITKIVSKINQKKFANRYFCAPNMQNLREEAVAKRDVYSLGAVLLYLLIGCPKSKAKDWAKKLEKSRDLRKFCDLGRGKNLLIIYEPNYNSSRTQKFIAFLKVIQQMVASSYSKRLSVDEALRFMRNVSLMSDR